MNGLFDRPRIVCLCGSTRFSVAFQQANLDETLAGRIVLSVGCMTHSDAELGNRITPDIKIALDHLHKKKIDLADEILVLNVDGYIGESTKGEIAHAFARGKRIRFLDEDKGEAWLEERTHELGRMAAAALSQPAPTEKKLPITHHPSCRQETVWRCVCGCTVGRFAPEEKEP